MYHICAMIISKIMFKKFKQLNIFLVIIIVSMLYSVLFHV